MGYQDMVLNGLICSSSGEALNSRHECALSQVAARPDVTLDVARTHNYNNNHQNLPTCLISRGYLIEEMRDLFRYRPG